MSDAVENFDSLAISLSGRYNYLDNPIKSSLYPYLAKFL